MEKVSPRHSRARLRSGGRYWTRTSSGDFGIAWQVNDSEIGRIGDALNCAPSIWVRIQTENQGRLETERKNHAAYCHSTSIGVTNQSTPSQHTDGGQTANMALDPNLTRVTGAGAQTVPNEQIERLRL